MEDQHPTDDLEVQRHLEELSADLARTRADVDELESRADVSEEGAREHRTRIDALEEHLDVDREMILELQEQGVLSQEHVAQLEEALRSARKIGAALGLVMAEYKVDEMSAFRILSKASQDTNRKVRVLAEELVDSGDARRLQA